MKEIWISSEEKPWLNAGEVAACLAVAAMPILLVFVALHTDNKKTAKSFAFPTREELPKGGVKPLASAMGI